MTITNKSALLTPLGDGGITPLGNGGKGKTLLLVRHAKSSWENVTLTDFERPLNERGKSDAPKMAKRLLHKKINIDGFITSPAKRTKKTAEIFIKEFGRKENELILVPGLYEASIETFYNIIALADNTFNSIAIFSHNPTITYFANELVERMNIDNMPTCSILAVKCDIKKWGEFKEAKKEFWFFDFPKNDS